MRLSNKKKTPLYRFFNTILLMILSGGCISFIVNEIRFNILDEESYFLIIVPNYIIDYYLFTWEADF